MEKRLKNKNILHPKLSYLICGLCFKAHNELGRYKSEKQYADAFEELLKESNIEYKREKALPESFKGEKARRNIPDFVIKDKIIVDFKAKRIITKEDYYQLRRYLDSYGKELGLIVNFREYYLKPKRVLNKFVDSDKNSDHSDNVI